MLLDNIVALCTHSAFGPLLDDSDSESSEDEGEISSPEVKALQASATKVRPVVIELCLFFGRV